jgi:predicted enzyme related to lactoylglutathione lyase
MHPMEKIDITLHVQSLEETFQWYQQILGWDSGCDLRDADGNCLFGNVHYTCEPFIGFNLLKSEKVITPAGFHPLIKTPEIDKLYAVCQSKKVEIVAELSQQPWGNTFKIKDCNGFILEFWSEV